MRELGAEVLEVTFSKPDRARFYVQNFTIPWPYLCDPDYAVRREWGLEERSHSPLYYVKNAFLGMTMEQPPNDYGASSPTMGEMTKLVRDDDMGLFVVDRDGIVRYAFSGSYMTEGGARKMPSNEEVLRELERFAAKGS
jgi:peroxiredoxin